MDLSKLPRLSESSEQPAPPTQSQTPPPVQVPAHSPVIVEGVAAQVWISGIIGLLLIMFGWTFAKFLIAKITGQPFHTNVTWQVGDKAGEEVSYFDLEGYTAYTQAAIFLFGVAMVLEAIILATVRRNTSTTKALVTFALVLTAGVTTFNLLVCGMLLQISTIPLISGLAVAYGGFIAMYEWQLLKNMR